MKFYNLRVCLLVLFLLFGLNTTLEAQQLFVSSNKENIYLFDYLSIKTDQLNSAGTPLRWYYGDSLFAQLKAGHPYWHQTQALFLQFAKPSVRDSFLSEKDGFWSNIYRGQGHLYEKYGNRFFFQVDPLLHLGARLSMGDDEDYAINGRGILLNAGIGDRVKIFSSLQEIQRSFASYTDELIDDYGSVPGAVFSKNYSSDLYRIQNGRDYNIARAMLQYEANDWLQLSLGHDNNFIGNGYRSLLLSDFSAPYFHLKVNTHLGRFHYQNIFAELQAEGQRDRRGDLLLTKKYFVNHYLGVSLRDNLNVGLSETVIFSRANQFELQYLNPVIFYRSVEQSLGSPDNVVLGMNAQWDLFDRLRLYGQFTFDEFIFREMFIENRGWWGNKWGSQLGAQITDVGLQNSLLRVEWNRIRPFTFQHRDSVSNFTHARQPMAHPSGANLNEWLIEWTWSPNEYWKLRALGMLQKSGAITDSESNWGTDPNFDFTNRSSNFDVFLINGPEQNVRFGLLQIERRIWNSLTLAVEYRFREQQLEAMPENDRIEQYLGLSMRWNWQTRDFAF